MTIKQQASALMKGCKELAFGKQSAIDVCLKVVDEKIKSERALTKFLSKEHGLNLEYDASYWNGVKKELKNL